MRIVDREWIVGGLGVLVSGLLLAALLVGGLWLLWVLVIYNHHTTPGG